MINVVVIPVALDEPLWAVRLDPKDFDTYQGIVGGNIRTLDLDSPPMKLYSNDVTEPPLNLRATLILWLYNSDLSGKGLISGRAFLTGNEEGADVSVPNDMLELLLHTGGYRIEVNGRCDGTPYDDLTFAYNAAEDNTGRLGSIVVVGPDRHAVDQYANDLLAQVRIDVDPYPTAQPLTDQRDSR